MMDQCQAAGLTAAGGVVLARQKITYDVWDHADLIMTGEIEAVCAFLGKSDTYIRAAAKDARRINYQYTVTPRETQKKSAKGTARYILWDQDQIVGVFKMGEIEKGCGIHRSTAINAARTGEAFLGRYKTMNFNRFSETWEEACGALRRRKRLK